MFLSSGKVMYMNADELFNVANKWPNIICAYEMAETFPFRLCCLSLYFHLIFCPVPFEHFTFTSCLSPLILFLLILLDTCPLLPTALNVGGDNVSVL